LLFSAANLRDLQVKPCRKDMWQPFCPSVNWNFIRLSVVLMVRPGQDEGGFSTSSPHPDRAGFAKYINIRPGKKMLINDKYFFRARIIDDADQNVELP